MPFTEICIYQVKPQKVEEFEVLMLEAKSLLEKQEGLLLLRLAKRGYRIDMAIATSSFLTHALGKRVGNRNNKQHSRILTVSISSEIGRAHV